MEETEQEKEEKTMKVGERVKRQSRYWDALNRGTSRQRRQLLKYATPDQVDAMSEITYNFLQGRLTIPRTQLKSLAGQKKLWRKIGDPGRSQKERRKWIQKGGGENMALLLRGLKQGVRRGVKQGVRKVQRNFSNRTQPSSRQTNRQDKIQELERDIQRMESTLETI